MTTNPWRRILGLLLPMVVLAAIPAVPATASGGAHPYFNDRGTLTWYHSLSEAKSAASQEHKLIFIEYGRQACGNCRTLCNAVLPDARVRARLSAIAVGLVAECDRPEPTVYWLFKRNLQNARMLPFAGFITPKGGWVSGFSGYASVSTFETHLAAAERMQERIWSRQGEAESAEPRIAKARSAKPKARNVPSPVAEAPRVAATPTRRAPSIARAPAAPTRTVQARPAPTAGVGCPDGGCADTACCPPTDCCPGGQCAAPDGMCCAPNGQCCAPNGQCCAPNGQCCAPNGQCCAPNGQCCAPNGLCIPGIGRLPLPGCSPCPCPPRTPAVVAQRNTTSDFPPPAPRSTQDGRVLAEATPAPVPAPMDDIGSPDGDAAPLPRPRVRTAAVGVRTAAAGELAGAAAKGDWATVVRATRGAGRDDEQLADLNRRAHSWAHGRLAAAVRALRERRFGDAQQAVGAVTTAMRGEPEAVDAERGAEAIELVRDLDHLATESPVRRAVRKNAYEKMRGTRWAPLFNDCAAPSPALSAR